MIRLDNENEMHSKIHSGCIQVHIVLASAYYLFSSYFISYNAAIPTSNIIYILNCIKWRILFGS